MKNNLKKIITEKNLTQREVAERSGIEEHSMSNYVRGKFVPNIVVALNLANVLDKDVYEIWEVDG